MNKKHSILCIDDEENILNTYNRLLRNEGYNIFIANNGTNGIEILRKNKIDLILCDQKMPEMNGFEVLRIARKEYPDTMRIMISGYSDFESLVKTINEGEIFRYISKPWDGEELKKVIKTALNQQVLIYEAKNLLSKMHNLEKSIKNVSVDINQDQATIQVKILSIDQSLDINNILDYIFKILDLKNSNKFNFLFKSIVKEKNSFKIEIILSNGLKLIIDYRG